MTNKMAETMLAIRSSMVKEVNQNFVSSGATVFPKVQGHGPGHAAPSIGVSRASDQADRGQGQGVGADQV